MKKCITTALFGVCYYMFLFTASGQKKPSVKVHPEFKRYFDDCGTNGSVVIFDTGSGNWIASDTTDIYKTTLPASTFKIMNLLIALETGVIADENTVVRWVGSTDTVKYGYRPDIYHDMSVKKAFELSAGWVYVELAKKIGKERYRKYLNLCNYGNGMLTQTDPDFWNFGEFGISPVNQVDFLIRLYNEQLPFSKRNMKIVKDVMINERKEQKTVHAKTGWTRDLGINTGWWVGYVESRGQVHFFATRLLQDRKFNRADFGNCRKEITRMVLKDLALD